MDEIALLFSQKNNKMRIMKAKFSFRLLYNYLIQKIALDITDKYTDEKI